MKWKSTIVVLVGIWIATSWSLFQRGFFRVHDYVHAARIAEMRRALTDGHWPVRWSENFGYGYGMPLFEFYAPLPSMVGALINWLGVDIVTSVKWLYLLTNAGTVLGSYMLGYKLAGRRGGMLLSVLYSLAPYRAVNLYVRGALSEAVGMMWLPWIIWIVYQLFDRLLTFNQSRHQLWTNPPFWWLGLVMTLAALMLTHNLTTLIFLPIVGLLIVGLGTWLIVSGKDRGKIGGLGLIWILSALPLALGISAFYWLPAVWEKDLTQINSILSGYFNYQQHFLYLRQFWQSQWAYGGSVWGPNDDISFFWGCGQWWGLVTLGLTSNYLLVASLNKNWLRKSLFNKFSSFMSNIGIGFTNLKRMVRHWSNSSSVGRNPIFWLLFWFLIWGVSIYLSLLKSAWLWQKVSVLSFLQFPWRWQAITALSLAIWLSLAVVMVIEFLPKKIGRLIVGSIIIVTLLNAQYFRPETWLANATGFYYSDPIRIRTQMSQILPDYLPQTLKIGELNGLAPHTSDIFYQLPEANSLPVVLVNRVHQKLISIQTNQSTDLTWMVAAFPGWRAELDGQSWSIGTTDQGLIKTTVPTGEHRLGLIFDSTPVRSVSDWLSAGSIFFLIWLAIPSTIKFDPKKLSTFDPVHV